jgi:hypothetical protein
VSDQFTPLIESSTVACQDPKKVSNPTQAYTAAAERDQFQLHNHKIVVARRPPPQTPLGHNQTLNHWLDGRHHKSATAQWPDHRKAQGGREDQGLTRAKSPATVAPLSSRSRGSQGSRRRGSQRGGGSPLSYKQPDLEIALSSYCNSTWIKNDTKQSK